MATIKLAEIALLEALKHLQKPQLSKIGTVAKFSGVYAAGGDVTGQVIPLSKGERFPPAKNTGYTHWQIILKL